MRLSNCRNRWVGWIAVAVLALAVLLPTGVRAPGAQEKPIRIGASISLTGKYARTGQEQLRGYELWAEHINARGASFGKETLLRSDKPGLLGRRVELVVLDDRSDPSTGVRLYHELIYNRKVDLLLGPFSSAVTNAVVPVIEEAQIPTPHPLAASTKIWQGKRLQWQVGIVAVTSTRLTGIGSLAKQAGARKLALIFEDSEFPRTAAEAVRNRAASQGLEVVLFEGYPSGISDWTPFVAKAAARGADILAGGGYLPDDLGIIKAAKALNYAPKFFAFLVGIAVPDFEQTLGDDALYMIGDTDWNFRASYPGAQPFVAAYRAKFNAHPSHEAPAAYGGAQILEEAVKRTGSITDRRAIRDVMYALDTLTVFGNYRVAPLASPDAGLQIGAEEIMLQVVKKDGQVVKEIVYPPAAATAKPLLPFPGWKR